MAKRPTWKRTLDAYDVEVFEDGWWFMYPRTGDPHAVDLGHARTRLTRFAAIWAAYVRRWWGDRHGPA